MANELVSTLIGDVPTEDLLMVTAEKDGGDSVVVTREWIYKGAKTEHLNQMVRRDVWVTIKRGPDLGSAATL